MRETLPVLVGTLVSQTLLNLLALLLLGVRGARHERRVARPRGGARALQPRAGRPRRRGADRAVPGASRARPGRLARQGLVARLVREAAAALLRLRKGLMVFRRPRSARLGDVRAARRLGAAAARRLRAAARAGSRRPRRHRRRRGGAVRGQRDRGAAGDALERGRLPARRPHRARRADTACPPRPRSATGSSCRRSRS